MFPVIFEIAEDHKQELYALVQGVFNVITPKQ